MHHIVRKFAPLLRRSACRIFSGLMVLVAGLSVVGLPQAWAAEENAASIQASAPIARVHVSASQLEWLLQTKEEYEYAVLRIAKPDGSVVEKTFTQGQPIVFSPAAASTFTHQELDDGRSAAAKKGCPQSSDSNRQNGLDGPYSSELRLMPASPPLSYVYYFTLKDGAILVPPQEPEPPPLKPSPQASKLQSQPQK